MEHLAIIYGPNDQEWKFSTKDLGDITYEVVDMITFNSQALSITVRATDIDGTVTNTTYQGMPFMIESWNS